MCPFWCHGNQWQYSIRQTSLVGPWLAVQNSHPWWGSAPLLFFFIVFFLEKKKEKKTKIKKTQSYWSSICIKLNVLNSTAKFIESIMLLCISIGTSSYKQYIQVVLLKAVRANGMVYAHIMWLSLMIMYGPLQPRPTGKLPRFSRSRYLLIIMSSTVVHYISWKQVQNSLSKIYFPSTREQRSYWKRSSTKRH